MTLNGRFLMQVMQKHQHKWGHKWTSTSYMNIIIIIRFGFSFGCFQSPFQSAGAVLHEGFPRRRLVHPATPQSNRVHTGPNVHILYVDKSLMPLLVALITGCHIDIDIEWPLLHTKPQKISHRIGTTHTKGRAGVFAALFLLDFLLLFPSHTGHSLTRWSHATVRVCPSFLYNITVRYLSSNKSVCSGIRTARDIFRSLLCSWENSTKYYMCIREWSLQEAKKSHGTSSTRNDSRLAY